MLDKMYMFFAQLTVDNSIPGVPKVDATNATLTNSLKIVFGIAGAITVLIITIAGFQYIVSGGDPQKVSNAKNAIIYAGVGLVVCVLAFAIVEFVVDRV